MDVIGFGSGGLSAGAQVLLEAAGLVVGGRRLLAKFEVKPEATVELGGDLSEAFDRMEGVEGRVAVLASGDPGFFGITRALAERFGSENLRILPAPSAAAEAFARVGLPWDDAIVVSAHGRERDRDGRQPRRVVNVCLAHPKVAVLTSPRFGPAELAEALEGFGAGRRLVVAEKLGEADERVVVGGAAEIAAMDWEDPNTVLVYDPKMAVAPKGWISGRTESRGGWALPEGAFEHRAGMITKSETRALVLSRLGPGPGDLVWDVGAGSGSVAVECARLGAAAIAVERDGESCGRIRRNAARLAPGAHVRVVEGEAPEALAGLPEPDAVFVGGTGGRFEETVGLAARRARRAVVMTLIGLERVLPAAEILEGSGFEVETTLLQASRVKGVASLRRLVPESPVFVVSGRRPQEEAA